MNLILLRLSAHERTFSRWLMVHFYTWLLRQPRIMVENFMLHKAAYQHQKKWIKMVGGGKKKKDFSSNAYVPLKEHIRWVCFSTSGETVPPFLVPLKYIWLSKSCTRITGLFVHKELTGKLYRAVITSSPSYSILSKGTLINIKEERKLGIFLIKSGAACQMRSVPRWGWRAV